MMPGISVWPERSMTLAPAGAFTSLAFPTAVIRPFSMTPLWSSRTGRPVPSISLTWVRTITGASAVMTSRSAGPIESARWACAVEAKRASPTRVRLCDRGMGRKPPSVCRERHDHARFEVLGDVAVRHPGAGVRHLQQNVGRAARRQQKGILPRQVRVPDSILREDQEPLSVKVDRVLHGVEGLPQVGDPDLDHVPHLEVPVDVHVPAAAP